MTHARACSPRCCSGYFFATGFGLRRCAPHQVGRDLLEEECLEGSRTLEEREPPEATTAKTGAH